MAWRRFIRRCTAGSRLLNAATICYFSRPFRGGLVRDGSATERETKVNAREIISRCGVIINATVTRRDRAARAIDIVTVVEFEGRVVV